MHILISGGCGYVGTNLTHYFLENGFHVTVVDLMWFGNYLQPHPRLTVKKVDVRKIDAVSMKGIDAVIHLANIANDPSGDLNPKLTWEVNVLASKLFVERAIKDGVKQFIYASSGSVYGVKEEEQVTEELSLVPISDYNKTKMVSERVLFSYQDDIVMQCIRPATICGYSPRMRLDLSVNLLTMQALTKQKMTVFGGSQVRPNIHIKDMIGVYAHLLGQGEKMQGVYNAGFENLSILDIAKKISQRIPAVIEVTESNDPRSYRLNSDKLLATGFVPRFCVMQGIEEVAEQYERAQLKDLTEYYNVKKMMELTV